jgi:DNA-binding CsgD family transcriptional regulator
MTKSEEMKELYKEGTRVRHIAQAYDMSTEAVYQHLRKLDGFKDLKKLHRAKLEQRRLSKYDELMPQIIEMRKQDIGAVAIAEKLGISYHTMKKLLKGTKWDNTKKSKMKRNDEMFKLYKEGMTQEELAKKFKCSQANISQTLERHYGDQL